MLLLIYVSFIKHIFKLFLYFPRIPDNIILEFIFKTTQFLNFYLK